MADTIEKRLSDEVDAHNATKRKLESVRLQLENEEDAHRRTQESERRTTDLLATAVDERDELLRQRDVTLDQINPQPDDGVPSAAIWCEPCEAKTAHALICDAAICRECAMLTWVRHPPR